MPPRMVHFQAYADLSRVNVILANDHMTVRNVHRVFD